MTERFNCVTVLAASWKFAALASFSVCPLSKIDRLVTEAAPPQETRAVFETAGGMLVLPR
jgi:DeoR family glycerol-3-phosphate regulon repressor